MKIHLFTYLYLLLALLVGYDSYVCFLLFSFLHEIGHYLIAYFLKFEIDGMVVLPFGAFLSLNDFGKHKVIDEILVVISGPLINLVMMLLFYDTYLAKINLFILVFNLLPIYPLDGSKLLLLVMSYFVDYYRCFKLQIFISYIMLLCFCFIVDDIGSYILLVYLGFNLYKYLKIYRYILYCVVINDNKNKGRYKINEKLSYYRPYLNVYKINEKIYSLEEMKIYLIKSYKSN